MRTAINPALERLPFRMRSDEARVMLLAIGLQESEFVYRRQQPTGPARGLWQFELGDLKTRGGVTGVLTHHISGPILRGFCIARGTPAAANPIYDALEHDYVLAAACARLLLWTDPLKMPDINDGDSAWSLYLRTWRPGKPRPRHWPKNHRKAAEAVQLARA